MSGCVVSAKQNVWGAPNLHELARKHEEALPDERMYRGEGDFF